MGFNNCAENKKLIGKLRIMAENLHPTLGKSILDAINIIEQLQTKNDGLQEDKKALRRVEVILKIWSSVINPNYKKIYTDIKQTIALKD